jgi:anaphase-promoting complex subunit 2
LTFGAVLEHGSGRTAGGQFIEGMLTNLGGLPLDRIQTMLKFAPGYDRTLDQLGAFMDAARREGLVNVKDGIWRLNR